MYWISHYRERVVDTERLVRNMWHHHDFGLIHPVKRFKNTSKEPNIIEFEYRKFKYHIEIGIRAIVTVVNKETGELAKYSMKPLKPQHLMHQCVIQFSGNDYENYGPSDEPSKRGEKLKNSPPIDYFEIKKIDDLKD